MDFAANWMVFGALLLAQFGLLDGLFSGSGGNADDKGPDETLPEDKDPAYDANAYGSEARGTEGADSYVVPENPKGGAYFGLGGNDSVGGSSKADFLSGGDGNDTINGQDGNDLIAGGAGDDALRASHGDDTVYGQDGNDEIDGSLGDDLIYGGSGNDKISGAGGNDTILGGSGNDTLSSDRLDRLDDFGRGTDVLNGGAGDDLLRLGDGDTGTGGEGTDTFSVVEVANPDQGPARITDFDQSTEQLQIYYKPVAGQPAPTPETTYDAATNTTRLSINGTTLVELSGKITFSDSNLKLIDQTK